MNRWKRLSSVALLVVVSAGLWVVYTYPPAEHDFYPRCAFKTMTGLDCPGCGGTRAAHALMHGRVGDAFRLNPILFLIGGVALAASPSLVRGEQPRFFARPWFGWTALVVLVSWWIVRNI